jgi:hypothetical protein
MTRMDAMPVGIGVMIGLMALMLLHGVLSGSGGLSGVLFVLAHVAVFAGAGVAVAFGLHRRWPLMGRVLRHRPSARDLVVVLGTAVVTLALLHLGHGGPTWT